MSKLSTLRRRWMKDSDFRAEYESLEEEFALAAVLMEARANADLTQGEVARRMRTSQAYVAKMEGGRINPSIKTLKRFADATGTRLKVSFVAQPSAGRKRPGRAA